MTDYDKKVLAEIANPGSQEGLHWGAAMSVALEFLQGRGYVTKGSEPQVTEAGRAALEAA